MNDSDFARIDRLVVEFYSQEQLLALGDAVLDEILEIVERNAGELMPVKTGGGKREVRYSRPAVKKQFAQRDKTGADWVLWLTREDKPEFELSFKFGSPSDIHFRFSLKVLPFDFYREEPFAQERTRRLVSFVREMARRFPPWYAFGHSDADAGMGVDESPRYGFLPKRASEVYWLNVYGKEMVDAMTRERVLATPAAHLEELPHGGVFFLTRPTPGDFNSEEARVAQAKAVVHLNPEQSFDAVLARLRQRSAALVSIAPNWDADIAALLEYVLDMDVALKDRSRETARFNAYRPPPVSEWLPLDEAHAGDVADVAAMVESYGVFAELLADHWYKQVPAMEAGGPDSLIPLDCHLWQFGTGYSYERERLERALIPGVGAYLGEMLVKNFGGRWVPRKNRDEAYIVLGGRAFLPFLRARHCLHDRQSVIDYSLTKFYREAERYIGAWSDKH